MITDHPLPAGIFPKESEALHCPDPLLPNADRETTDQESVSLSITFVAVANPLLPYVIRKFTASPENAGNGVISVLCTQRSANHATTPVAVAALFPVVYSGVTVVVLAI